MRAAHLQHLVPRLRGARAPLLRRRARLRLQLLDARELLCEARLERIGPLLCGYGEDWSEGERWSEG